MSNARCWRQQLATLAIATSLLSGCATVTSEGHAVRIYPPAVDYSPEFQAQAAEEIGLPPEKSAIAQILSDYEVMREQARVCRSGASEIAPGGGGTAM